MRCTQQLQHRNTLTSAYQRVFITPDGTDPEVSREGYDEIEYLYRGRRLIAVSYFNSSGGLHRNGAPAEYLWSSRGPLVEVLYCLHNRLNNPDGGANRIFFREDGSRNLPEGWTP